MAHLWGVTSEETAYAATKEDNLNLKQYNIIFHMASASELKLKACFSQKDLKSFIDAFSSNENITQWMQQTLPKVKYLLNLSNINIVEIEEIEEFEEDPPVSEQERAALNALKELSTTEESKDLENKMQEPKQT